MDNAFTCSSHDLYALQRHALSQCSSLFPSPGGISERVCGDVHRAVIWQKSTPRKAVQTLTFDEVLAYYQPSSRGVTSSCAAGASVKSSSLTAAARGGGGGLCALHHRGPHCFPTRRYRTALSSWRYRAEVHDSGLVCDSDSEHQWASETTGAPPGSDVLLLWSVLPPHLLVGLVKTPQDAEVLLERLKEEQQLLQRSVNTEMPSD
ncbi:hypothetical protein JKF63_00364 [Porcisia hertigi]|uniref:Uncharacterized protein n=1 Tax=Porcisia hertigi TaxID=2761500 RepID=A0A836HTG5_9TRYP|nr:hypothetical protein JKF63_00364 [Porcisia hertigi]